VFDREQPLGVVAIAGQRAFHGGSTIMTRTDDLLIGLLSLGWIAWLYNVVRYRGLSRTARGLIAQNTRLIEANESLRWQNGSLLAELGHRKRAEPVAHDPVAHDPVAHDPVAPDPVADDPAVHDPAARESVRVPDYVIDLTAEPGEVPRRDDAESN
jgi:hypothetical protein